MNAKRTLVRFFIPALFCLLTQSMFALTFGKFGYRLIDGGSVVITSYDAKASGTVAIPSEIEGKTVTSIGDYAFEDCTGLTSITIPGSITSIGEDAFGYCTSLTSINVNSGNDYYSSIDGVLFNKKKSEPIAYPTGKTGAYELPGSVTSIGDEAFNGCTGLTSITIPDSVTSIQEFSFYRCTGLTSINVKLGNTYYSSKDGVLFNKKKSEIIICPVGKTGNYVIPSSVTSIGNSAFNYCTSLTSITIHNSVTSIGDEAFHGCAGLTSITIPNSVTSIGDYAFLSCTSLTSITIPNGVTSIGDAAFGSCTSLTSITIPNGVTSIGDGAFSSCTSLTSITIPNGVTSIGDAAFGSCTSLTSITIPNGVTSIGYEAFGSCTSLTSITIPNSVTSIGESAFHHCPRLTSITIPNSVTSIGVNAFNYCTRLTSITIPNSVTSIGDNAFYYCTGLTSITIPNSVTSIGFGAFGDCINLSFVLFLGNAPSTSYDAFPLNAPGFTIYFMEGASGFTTPKWNDYPAVDLTSAPKIAVKQPLGTNLTDDTARKDFGAIKLGLTSLAKQFTVKNKGDSDLRGLQVAITGTNRRDFTFSRLDKTRLNPGASTTFMVTFKPQATGLRKASIHIFSNDPNHNSFDIRLVGEGK